MVGRTRRSLVGAVAACIVSGCAGPLDFSGSSGGDSGEGRAAGDSAGTRTQTESRTRTSTPLAPDETYALPDSEAETGLRDVRATRSVEYLENPELIGVAHAADGAFLFVDAVVSPAEDSPPRSSFAVVADGTHVGPADRVADATVTEVHMATGAVMPYPEAEHGGLLAFEVPAVGGAETDLAVELDLETGVVRWELPVGAREIVAADPELRLVDWELPAEIAIDEPFTTSLAVANDGSSPGTLHARLKPRHVDQAETIVREAVEPGDSEEIDVELRYPSNRFVDPKEPGETVTYALDWRGDAVERQTELRHG